MINVISNPRERTRFLRFAFVGIIGAIVDFGVMNLLVSLFAVPFVIAGTISFISAILSNFTWNRFWTYPDSRSKTIPKQLLEFSIVSIIGLAIRIPTLAFLKPVIHNLVSWLPFEFHIVSPDMLSDNITLAIAVIIVMFWNFFANRFWTYSDIE